MEDALPGLSRGYVIPRRLEEANPESRDSGSGASHQPGMTEQKSGFPEQLFDVLPVHEVFQERLQIVGPAVAIVDVVGVLPDVAAEDRGGAVHQRILAVRRLGDFELAVLHLEPAPAGAELGSAGRGEIGLELLEPAEVLVDLLLQAA